MKQYSFLVIVFFSLIFFSVLPTILQPVYAVELTNKCEVIRRDSLFNIKQGYYTCRCVKGTNKVECPILQKDQWSWYGSREEYDCPYKVVEAGDTIDDKKPSNNQFMCAENMLCEDKKDQSDKDTKTPQFQGCKPDPAKVKGCGCKNPDSLKNDENGFWCDAEDRNAPPTHFCSPHQICSDKDPSNAPDKKCVDIYCACRQESGKGTKMACKRADDGQPFPAENADPNIKETACPQGTVCIGRDITGGSARCGTEQDLKNTEDVSKAKKSGITCTCQNGGKKIGDKNNGMDCTKNGVSFGYTLYCPDANQGCVNGADKTWPMSDTSTDSSLDGDIKGKIHDNIDKDGEDWTKQDGLGFACEDQASWTDGVGPTIPPLPAVPPPPCGTANATGVCMSFNTAFGLIDTDASGFLLKLFAMALAIAGGLAVLLIMRAGYTIMTSAGNAEGVKKGREQLIAAIVGLLFIIFSFVILQVIGVDILRLRDFSGASTGGTVQTCTQGTPGCTCRYNNSTLECVMETPAQTQSTADHCTSCTTAEACRTRGGTSRGALDCTPGQVCCE